MMLFNLDEKTDKRVMDANRKWLGAFSIAEGENGAIGAAWFYLTGCMQKMAGVTREEADDCIRQSFSPRENEIEYHICEIGKRFADNPTMQSLLDQVRVAAKIVTTKS